MHIIHFNVNKVLRIGLSEYILNILNLNKTF
jgi:hypothetical protein